MTPICKRRGCNAPVVPGKRGNLTDYCATHLDEQRAVWRAKENAKRHAGTANGACVRVLRICAQCGRGYWLATTDMLTCDCTATKTHEDNINLALIVPREDGGGTVQLYDAAFTPTGMTSYSSDPSDYRALRERLKPDYVVAVVSEV